MLKLRDELKNHADPGCYKHPKGTFAYRVSSDPAQAPAAAKPHDIRGMNHGS